MPCVGTHRGAGTRVVRRGVGLDRGPLGALLHAGGGGRRERAQGHSRERVAVVLANVGNLLSCRVVQVIVDEEKAPPPQKPQTGGRAAGMGLGDLRSR